MQHAQLNILIHLEVEFFQEMLGNASVKLGLYLLQEVEQYLSEQKAMIGTWDYLTHQIPLSSMQLSLQAPRKNVGVTGITVVIIRKSLLTHQTPSPDPAILRRLSLGSIPGPIVLDYATVAKHNSLYNTLPIFNLWIAGQVIAMLVKNFGAKKITGQEEIAGQKASLIYATLDKYPQVYHVVPDKAVRSRMNICFRVHGGDADKEKEFLAGAEMRLLQGLKGHRSVGGIRVSNYNAVLLESVEKLVTYLEDYVIGR